MKNYIFVLFVATFAQSNFAHAALDFDKNYTCTYQIRELVTINLYGRTSKKYVTYSSRQTARPIEITVDDYKYFADANLLKVYGDLPAPWAAGTSYEIEVRSPFASTFRVIGSHRTVSIPMVCREL